MNWLFILGGAVALPFVLLLFAGITRRVGDWVHQFDVRRRK